MASRLNRPNGWRRLWLAVSAGLAIWFVVVWPLQSLKDMQFGRSGYDRAIEEDFESGQCLTYQTAPLEKLREPNYGEGCWHIYTSRKYDNTVPYTLEARDNSNSATDRNWYLMALGIGAAGTAITSGLVYFLGWVIGWILTGY
jgi:hypothetical protein